MGYVRKGNRVVRLLARSVLAVWRMSPLFFMWNIRRKRNARCFEDREMAVEELKNILVKTLYIWTRVYNFSHFSIFFFEFVNFCSFHN